MKHAERVKELAEELAQVCDEPEDLKPYYAKRNELHTAIDAMQYALDDAVAKLAATEECLAKWVGLHEAAVHVADNLTVRLVAREAEVATLRRWKSTNAPRLEALQGLLKTAQKEAHAGFEAVATLASEREANSILTAEVERLRKDAERAHRYERLLIGCRSAMRAAGQRANYATDWQHMIASINAALSEEVKAEWIEYRGRDAN